MIIKTYIFLVCSLQVDVIRDFYRFLTFHSLNNYKFRQRIIYPGVKIRNTLNLKAFAILKILTF